MKRSIGAFVFAAIAMAASGAGAADLGGLKDGGYAVAAGDKMNWAGPSVGIDVGWMDAQHHVDITESHEGGSLSLLNLDSLGGDGFAGRVIGEYDFAIGYDWYVGGRAHYGIGGADTTVTLFETVKGELKRQEDYGASAIFGKALGSDSSTLAYVHAGYQWAAYDLSVSDHGTSIPLGAYGVDDSKTFGGFTVGVGVHHAFTPNLIGSLEYSHFEAGSEDWIKSGGQAAKEGLGAKDDLRENTVFAGLRYKF